MTPIPDPRHPMDGLILDEESLLLFQKVQEKGTKYSSFQRLSDEDSQTVPASDSAVTLSSLGDFEYQQGPIHLELWQKYYSALQSRPILVKSMTAFVLLGLADVIAQTIEIVRNLHPNLNYFRVMRFSFFGLAGAPWTHYYYDWLDRELPPTPQPWTWTTAIKVAIDQFLQAPALLAVMITGMALMEGRGIIGIVTDMQKDYTTALIKNWELWIPATVVNIAFIKPDLRVLYDNLIFFFWTIFLSMLLNDFTES